MKYKKKSPSISVLNSARRVSTSSEHAIITPCQFIVLPLPLPEQSGLLDEGNVVLVAPSRLVVMAETLVQSSDYLIGQPAMGLEFCSCFAISAAEVIEESDIICKHRRHHYKSAYDVACDRELFNPQVKVCPRTTWNVSLQHSTA